MEDEICSWLNALDGVAQDPVYHPEGDALFHSLQVFEHALGDGADPELLCAALLHDVGKAYAGRDHAEVGADMLVGLPHRVRWLVGHHLDLLRAPRRTGALLSGTPQLADLRRLRAWDLAGRQVRARVREPEEAAAIVAERWGMSERTRRTSDREREAVAREAARLMYREGVTQYFDAKRIAARRVLGRDARAAQFRPQGLPSNGEIRAALTELVELAEGRDRSRRVFAMRVVALELLEALACWDARLIGSVASGHARRGSDIDLHVFGEPDDIELDVWHRGWTAEREEVLIRVPGGFRKFHHLHVLDQAFPVELSVYPRSERRVAQRSSVDGKRIDRVGPGRLEALIRDEHAEAWAAYVADGVLDLDGLDDGPPPGDFAGLLAELDDPGND